MDGRSQREVPLHRDFRGAVGFAQGFISSFGEQSPKPCCCGLRNEGKREEPARVGGLLKPQEERRAEILFSRWEPEKGIRYRIIFLEILEQGSSYLNGSQLGLVCLWLPLEVMLSLKGQCPFLAVFL